MANFHREHETLSPAMEQIPIHSLKDLPVSISHGFTKLFTSACEREGFEPDYMNISTSRFTSSLWIANKRTVSIIVGSSSYDLGDSCVREIIAEDLLSQRMFAINRSRKLSTVAESFLQFCRRHWAVPLHIRTDLRIQDRIHQQDSLLVCQFLSADLKKMGLIRRLVFCPVQIVECAARQFHIQLMDRNRGGL